MSEIKKLEEQLKKKAQKSIIEVIGDILSIGYKELKNTVYGILSVPKGGKNQINNYLDNFENKIIENRQHEEKA